EQAGTQLTELRSSLPTLWDAFKQAKHLHASESEQREIDAGAKRTAQSIGEIASATHEQQAASQEIDRNVEKISIMAEDNSRSISGLSSAVHKLKKLALNFESGGAQFQT
ncbi:MAG: hypothetical protein Q8R64_16365, partial [Sulfurimicrobium sp.]|nr:hypothetical protein [Sulfurimicrobium sp.]